MATSVAPRNTSPTAARRPRPPPPQRVQSTQYAAPTLSRLTTKTRSSSASRLYSQDYLSPSSPSTPPLGSINDSASLLVDKKTSAHLGKDGKESIKSRVKGKGKGKAVAFVVGIPSSGEEGDLDVDQSEREGTATSERVGPFVNGCDGYSLPPQRHSEPTIDEIIRSQIRQPIRSVDSLDLDSLLPLGISDYSFVLQPPSSAKSSSSNVAQSGTPPADDVNSIVDRPNRVSMGKGKFSEVLLVRKGDAEFALKHTPLHPHHPLIANRLLREPTILAQLLPHPNLVKVFETIRTGGHFYLVEESLRSSITLEAFVTSFPGGVLPLPVAWSVLEQLSSVVRSLHEPLRVVHRDIKPENILVRVTPPSPSSPPETPPTVVLKLLDFGLATHFSASEPKLTTCCGSPAYHSPELWKGLREPSGTVPYWGPEIDIWCCGLTLLRCITPTGKYPLGTSHTSLQSLSDKIVDRLLAVPDPSIRQVLAGFLQLSGMKRMKAFERYCTALARRATPGEESMEENGDLKAKKEFKTTTFIPTEMTHRLDLPLDTTFAMTIGPNLEASVVGDEFTAPSSFGRRSKRSSSSPVRELYSGPAPTSPRISPTFATASTAPVSTGMTVAASTSPPPQLTPDLVFHPASFPDSMPPTPASPSSETVSLRHLAYPPPIEIVLLNPTNEPVRRAISYIKYSLRCAGILYHVRDDTLSSTSALTPTSPLGDSPASMPPTPFTGSFHLPTLPDLDDPTFCSYLQCVVKLPPAPESSSKASSALIAALRPPISRAHTTESISAKHARSASTPAATVKLGQRKKETVEALTFYLSIRKVTFTSSSDRPRHSHGRRSGSATPTRRRNSKDSRIVITLSDDRALSLVRDALAVEPLDTAVPPALVPVPDTSSVDGRGRREARSGSVLSPRSLESGSRDARARRQDTLQRNGSDELAPVSDGKSTAEGLGMDMGPRRSVDEGKSGGGGGGLFDLAGFVGRLVGANNSQEALHKQGRRGSVANGGS